MGVTNDELRVRLVRVLEQGGEDANLLSQIYAFMIGPYAESWEAKMPKSTRAQLEELRKQLRVRFNFDDSE